MMDVKRDRGRCQLTIPADLLIYISFQHPINSVSTSVSKYQVVIFFYYIFITLSGVIASALAEVFLI